jgi:mono/diheme cytochrome c family protein
MQNLRFTLVGLAAVIIAFTAINLSGFFEAETPRQFVSPDPSDVMLVNTGQVIYADHCAACHGAELEGEKDWKKRRADGSLAAPPHDETGHTWHHADELLLQIISQGGQAFMPKGSTSNMPGYSDKISMREISAVLAFIKSRWPLAIQERQQMLSRRQQQQKN